MELTLLIPGAGGDQTLGICVVAIFRPFGAWGISPQLPIACAVGFILLRLRGWTARWVQLFRGVCFRRTEGTADSSLALRARRNDMAGVGRVPPRFASAGQPRRLSLRGSWWLRRVAGRGFQLFLSRKSALSQKSPLLPKSGRSGAPISTGSLRQVRIAFDSHEAACRSRRSAGA